MKPKRWSRLTHWMTLSKSPSSEWERTQTSLRSLVLSQLSALNKYLCFWWSTKSHPFLASWPVTKPMKVKSSLCHAVKSLHLTQLLQMDTSVLPWTLTTNLIFATLSQGYIVFVFFFCFAVSLICRLHFCYSFELVLRCDPYHKKALFNLAGIMHMLDYPTLAVGYIVRLLLLGKMHSIFPILR